MNKRHLRRDKKFGKKFIVESDVDINREEAISFSLTKKETRRYRDWIASLWSDMKIDDSEDIYVLYPKIQFSPYEMGTMITAIVGEENIILRTAYEDDEIRKKK